MPECCLENCLDSFEKVKKNGTSLDLYNFIIVVVGLRQKMTEQCQSRWLNLLVSWGSVSIARFGTLAER